jgi:hypothetical protein
MLMYQQDTLYATAHSNLLKFISHPLKPCRHRRVLFKERFLCAKCVICKRIPTKEKNYYVRAPLSVYTNVNKLSAFTRM